MGTANFNPGFFAGLRAGLPSAETWDPMETESLSAAEEAAATLPCFGGWAGRPGQDAAIAMTVPGTAAVFFGQQVQDWRSEPRRHAEEQGRVASIFCEGKRAFPEECRVDGPPRKRQKTGNLTLGSLPIAVAERIFHFMSLKDQVALSVACKAFRAQLQAFYQPRCHVLLAADAREHWLTRLGIHCPEGQAVSPARMEAMVSRLQTIMEATTQLLHYVPGCLVSEYTAEELVLSVPPKHVLNLLKAAYPYQLSNVFHCGRTTQRGWEAVSEPHGDESVLKATQGVRACSAGEEAQKEPQRSACLSDLMCIPFDFGRLKNLRELNLSNACLTAVPEALGQLARLEALSLCNNQLNTLPDGLKQLANLQTLSLSGNRLAEVPAPVWRLMELRVLDVSNNHLLALSGQIGGLTNLQTLLLNENLLSGVPAEVGHLTKLERLSLADNQLKTLPSNIGQMAGLICLSVSGNQLVGPVPGEVVRRLQQGGTMIL